MDHNNQNLIDIDDAGLSKSKLAPLRFAPVLIIMLLVACLVRWLDFIVFHTGVELFIAVVAASVFVVGWNGRRYVNNGFYLIIAVSFLFISIVHALHMLAYKGLEVIGDGSNTATQLWMIARFLNAGTFLLAPLLIRRRPNIYLLISAYALVSTLLLMSVFVWDVFPECYNEARQGLTPFKVAGEYVISAAFIAAIILLRRERKQLHRNVYHTFIAAVVAGILAEMAFTLYTDVYGLFNMIGHLLTLVSFAMIYKGFVEVMIRSPYKTLFRELKRSEERYRNVVELSPDAILLHRENAFVFANTAALRLFGAKDTDDLLCRTPFEMFHPESHPLLRQRIGLLEQGGTVPLGEARIVRMDGGVRSVEMSASPLSGLDGAAAQVILRDITDRKRAEEALRESERKFRSVVDANMIGVFFANPVTGGITDANDEYLRIIGRPREDLEAGILNKRDITPPEVLAHQDEVFGGLALDKPIPPFEKEYVRPDGSRIPVIMGGSFLDPTGQKMVGFVLDYTDQKQAEREREITIAFLRLVNDTTALDDLIKASVEFFSEQSGCEAVGIRLQQDEDYPYYGTTGFSSDFVRAESSLCVICDAAPPRDEAGRLRLDCLCGCVIRGRLEGPFGTPAGSFWTNNMSGLIAGDDGGLPPNLRGRCNAEGYESVALMPLRYGDRVMGLLQMNDRRKHLFSPRLIALWERLTGYLTVALAKALAEEALRESAASLKRSNRDLEQFAYVASHDLQEPLRQISGFVRLLGKNYGHLFDAEAKEFFDFIQDGAIRMQSLINDLLQYSRVGRQQTFTSVDLNEVCHMAGKNLQTRILEADATIKINPLPRVNGNSTLLAQVFQNLIGNSLKFQGEKPPQIEVDAREHGAEWLVSIKDNGIGFEAEHAENIFVIFQRLHRRGLYEGTGIGLAICKRAVEQHGGRIWAESKPNQGATFYFTLPAAKH